MSNACMASSSAGSTRSSSALKAVEGSEASARSSELVRYQAATDGVVTRISALPPPAGLEPFRDDVLAAFRLQRIFFEKAVEARRSGGSMDDVWRIPEGRQASGRLIAAWGRMQTRYPQWSRETSDSVYHHLCAPSTCSSRGGRRGSREARFQRTRSRGACAGSGRTSSARWRDHLPRGCVTAWIQFACSLPS